MKTKKRKRGGVSMPCPKCRSDSRVGKTRRATAQLLNRFGPTIVVRTRFCLKHKHRFATEERVVT